MLLLLLFLIHISLVWRFASARLFLLFALNTHCALVQLHCRKEASTIQCGSKKCGTRARVFSQTLADGNSKNDNLITQSNRRTMEEERREYGKK